MFEPISYAVISPDKKNRDCKERQLNVETVFERQFVYKILFVYVRFLSCVNWSHVNTDIHSTHLQTMFRDTD